MMHTSIQDHCLLHQFSRIASWMQSAQMIQQSVLWIRMTVHSCLKSRIPGYRRPGTKNHTWLLHGEGRTCPMEAHGPLWKGSMKGMQRFPYLYPECLYQQTLHPLNWAASTRCLTWPWVLQTSLCSLRKEVHSDCLFPKQVHLITSLG